MQVQRLSALLIRLTRHVVCVSVFSLGLISPVLGITFNLVYRGPGSASPDPRATTNPNDANGTLLAAQMQQAAAEWADIVEDSFTMTINYFYAGIVDVPTGTANANSDVSVGGNRTQVGTIMFFDNRNWWFDPTPQNDSEFSMQQTLLKDLSASDQATGFSQSGINTGLLEVGYRGSANGSNPGAALGFDTLFTARHEIGHLMGVTSQLGLIEFTDLDYDIPSSLIAGANIGVNIFPGDVAHLAAVPPLLSGVATQAGIRVGISATDVFAAAALSGWTQIDLPRQDYLSTNTSFGVAANWAGNQVPGPTDSAFIRHGGIVNLTAANDTIQTLLVAEGSQLRTNANSLFVQGTATIGPSSGGGTARITAGAGGSFTAGNLVINAGELVLEGGVVAAQSQDIVNNSTIRGHGTIRVRTILQNNHVLRADGGTLVIEEFLSGSNPRISLGAFGDQVLATTGSLDINVGVQGTFFGTMTIGGGRFIDIASDWRMQGQLTLDGTATQTAELRGGRVEVAGQIEADRRAAILANVETTTQGAISVPQSNDELTFGGLVTYAGGNHTGAGAHIYNNNLQFNFGTLNIGSMKINSNATIAGGTASVSLIDSVNGDLSFTGGTFAFDKLIGKLVHSGGVLTVGQTLIDGTYSQGNSAIIDLNIGGASPGSYSSLEVTDDASLNGSLRVALSGGYMPSGGQQFLVLTAEHLSVGSIALTGGAAGMFHLIVDGNSVILQAVGIPGDYNNDGIVNAADYVLWRDRLGSSAGSLPNDPAGGTISSAQYANWKANFGRTNGSGSLAGNAIPEPTTFVLILTILVGYCFRRSQST